MSTKADTEGQGILSNADVLKAFNALSEEKQELFISYLNDEELMKEVMTALIKGPTDALANGDITISGTKSASDKSVTAMDGLALVPFSTTSTVDGNITVSETLVMETDARRIPYDTDADNNTTRNLFEKTVTSTRTAYYAGAPFGKAINGVTFIHDGSNVKYINVVIFAATVANSLIGDISGTTTYAGIDNNRAVHVVDVTYQIGNSTVYEEWGVWGDVSSQGEW